MPLLFFIDKDILDDPTCRHVDDVVLSYTFFKYADLLLPWYPADQILHSRRARRNQQGHLEPDAAENVVQASMGFDKYEHASKKENRI
jgi:cytochrome c oxidase assembly protein subunit 11